MKLSPLGANQTEVHLGSGYVIFFSYETPVAASTPSGYIRTSQRFSATTTRHINGWLSEVEAKEVPQETFDSITGIILDGLHAKYWKG